MKILSKDDIDNRRKIKALINKDDGDIPSSEKELNELFQNLDPADLFIAQKEYLLNSGVPEEAIVEEDGTLSALLLALNIDEWAPALFRLLAKEKKRRQRDKKRIIVLDNLFELPGQIDKSYLRIENRALVNQRVTHLVLTSPNTNIVKVLKILVEDPETRISQKKIAKKVGVTQGTISKIYKELLNCL